MRLRSELRTAQGTQVSPPKVPKAPPPKGRRGGLEYQSRMAEGWRPLKKILYVGLGDVLGIVLVTFNGGF